MIGLLEQKKGATSPPIGLNTNLIAYWKFDSDGVDSVGLKSPILSTSVNYGNVGIIGNSLEGTAANSILRFADSDDFSFTSGGGVDLPFSISMWVKVDVISSTGNWLLNKRNGTSGGDEWQIIIGGSALGAGNGTVLFYLFDRVTNAAFIANRTGNVAGSGRVLELGFGHVVITYSGSKTSTGIKIYVNGVQQPNTYFGSGTYTGVNNSDTTMAFLNANWNPSAGTKHNGKIDECGIWKNRELTASEVSALYNGGVGLAYPF